MAAIPAAPPPTKEGALACLDFCASLAAAVPALQDGTNPSFTALLLFLVGCSEALPSATPAARTPP